MDKEFDRERIGARSCFITFAILQDLTLCYTSEDKSGNDNYAAIIMTLCLIYLQA
jgi:hypothetical protein